MKNRILGLVILISLLLTPSGMGYQTVSAQDQDEEKPWSEAIDLCTTDKCWFPKMTSDLAGNIHVVWGSWGGSEAITEQATNTIYYTRYDGKTWTEPLDIIIAPATEGTVEIGDIFVAPDGMLYLAWGSDGTVYVSNVPVELADNAREWTTTVVDEGTRPRLGYDPERNYLYCIYILTLRDESDTSDQEPRQLYNIMVTYAEDSDLNWAERASVFELRTKNATAVVSNVVVGQNGVVHISWSENTLQSNWLGASIWYARIINDGETIQSTIQKLSGPTDAKSPNQAYPYLVECPDGDLFAFWSNGVGSDVGRYYRFSYDTGNNWEPIENAFAGAISGLTGMPGIICTNNKIEVATSAFSGLDILTGVRYSTYDVREKTWTQLESIEVKDHPGEHPSLALTHGNRLHLIWNDYENAGIMYTMRELDSQMQHPRGIAKPTVIVEGQAVTPTVEVSTPTPTQISYHHAQVEQTPNHNLVLVTSVLPVLLLAAGLIIFTTLRARR